MHHIKQQTKHAETQKQKQKQKQKPKKGNKKSKKETNKMAKLIAIALLGHFPKNFVTGFCSFRDTHTH